ncbi:MAG TPA: class I SAM-dependent methyltransferase [Hyphomicrobiaceae bacterium]|jgi:SAM-dependent methyltransferase|nr:class I SAM-dependent methyltransferase [Hyphomicrobiaceae bacterium]
MALNPEEAERLRAFERRRHDAMAATYHGFFANVTELAINPLLTSAGVTEGTRHLDVATGPGLLAAEAHRRGAGVTGVDLSPGMIELAAELHPDIVFQVAEVEHLPFPDETFDAVTCSFGLGHFPYPEAAVAECVRTLRPGGRLAFSWWAEPSRQRVQGLFRDAIAEVGAGPPPELPKGHSSLRFCNADEFRRLLVGVGLDAVAIGGHETTHRVSDVETLWHGGLGSLALSASAVLHQDAATQAAIKAALAKRAAAYETASGLEIPVAFRVGAGRKR